MEVQSVQKQKRQKSAYFNIMKFIYIAMHILCCFDFGFFECKSKKLRIFGKLITIIQCSIMCCVCVFTFANSGAILISFWTSVYLGHYYLTVIVLVLFDCNATICKFHLDLELIDFKLKLNNSSYDLEKYLLVVFILDLSFRIAKSYVYCLVDNVCLQPVSSAIVYIGLIISINIVYLSYSFVFYALNCRLKKLASILDAADSDFTSLQSIYKVIVELAVMHKTVFDPVYLIALLFCIPEVMASMFGPVHQLVREKATIYSLNYRSGYLLEIEALLLTLSPAICAGLLSTQADRIKIILHHKLMEEQDETKVYEIERFIQYVEARPCQFNTYNVLPLDANLFKMVLNFCVTYLIVIIQFTSNH